jgi:hypothetical protein
MVSVVFWVCGDVGFPPSVREELVPSVVDVEGILIFVLLCLGGLMSVNLGRLCCISPLEFCRSPLVSPS